MVTGGDSTGCGLVFGLVYLQANSWKLVVIRKELRGAVEASYYSLVQSLSLMAYRGLGTVSLKSADEIIALGGTWTRRAPETFRPEFE